MKTAVLLNGNVRTIDQCKKSILNCFKQLEPDYYVSTYYNQFGYHPAVKESIGYYEDPILSFDEIKNKFIDFNLKNILIENIIDLKGFFNKEEEKFNINMKNLESSFLQYLKIKKGLIEIDNFEKNNNITYDIIIKTRCDIDHTENLNHVNLFNINKKLIISNGNVFPNDCVLISSRDNMFKIIDFMIKEFYEYTNQISNENAPHGLLLSASQNLGLEIESSHIMNYVIRANKIQYY